MKTVCKYVLISIVYKDLNNSSLNLRETSKKIKETVHREIESGNPIDEPHILTELDKEIIEFESKTEKEKLSKNLGIIKVSSITSEFTWY